MAERRKNFVKSKPSCGDEQKLTRPLEESEQVVDDVTDDNSPCQVLKRPLPVLDGAELQESMRGRVIEGTKEDIDSSDGIRLGLDESCEGFSHQAVEENPTSPVVPTQQPVHLTPSQRLLFEEESSFIPAEYTRR